MPAIHKTIYPRIRKHLERRGLLKTAWRCLLGPSQIIKEYSRSRKDYPGLAVPDQFDLKHGIETSTRVHPTDLKIDSPNRICSAGYWPTRPEIFHEALSEFNIRYEDFIFVDFGSGKGRVLLMASDYPFLKIIGVEFSSELHALAQDNIRQYNCNTQKCRDITSIYMDFTEFLLPTEPLVLFFYNPASSEVMATVATNIARSLVENERPIFVIYVTPTYDVFESANPLRLRKIRVSTDKYSLYTNRG
jgi:SAM-dependent methyltransferase